MTVTARQAYTHGARSKALKVTTRGTGTPTSVEPVAAFTRVNGKTVSGELYAGAGLNEGFSYTFFPGGANAGLLTNSESAA